MAIEMLLNYCQYSYMYGSGRCFWRATQEKLAEHAFIVVICLIIIKATKKVGLPEVDVWKLRKACSRLVGQLLDTVSHGTSGSVSLSSLSAR
jgi:hypothetical protein